MSLRMRSANSTSILRGSIKAVTSPAPQIGWLIVCPARYVRVLSYGSLFTDFEPPLVVLEPFENELRVLHFGQVTREIKPLLVIEATTWPRSSWHTTQSFSTLSPIAYVCFSVVCFSIIPLE